MNDINQNMEDRIFDIFNYLFFTLILLIVIYPLYWIIIASVSNPSFVNSGNVVFIPKGLNFAGYERLFNYDRIWLGYKNSLIYALSGTAVNLTLILPAGYALSRKDLVGRSFFIILIIITMFFGGGLIPTYMLVKNLGMENTIWAMIIPNAASAFNIIISRTFFQSNIPDELLESARIDNCRNFRFFVSIALPLSVPLIAVITIFSAVGHWNSYFQALIYIRNADLYPLQLILREILILEDVSIALTDPTASRNLEERRIIAEQIKYGVIIIASLPVLILYPFLQKYFVKGVMIGSLKG